MGKLKIQDQILHIQLQLICAKNHLILYDEVNDDMPTGMDNVLSNLVDQLTDLSDSVQNLWT